MEKKKRSTKGLRIVFAALEVPVVVVAAMEMRKKGITRETQLELAASILLLLGYTLRAMKKD